MRAIQLRILVRWLAALYVTEQWTPLIERRGRLWLRAKARQIVVFDRTLNDQQWELL